MRTRQTRGDGFRADDMTRNLQYRGADPSGYEREPTSDDAGDVGGYFTEATPGNEGEPGGRWHDHEMPYVHEARASDKDQPELWGGFRPVATELYAGGYLGALAYGQGGREGSIPPELVSPPPESAHFEDLEPMTLREDTLRDALAAVRGDPRDDEPNEPNDT